MMRTNVKVFKGAIIIICKSLIEKKAGLLKVKFKFASPLVRSAEIAAFGAKVGVVDQSD